MNEVSIALRNATSLVPDVDQRVVEDGEGGATGGFSGLHCSYQLVEQLHGVERALGIRINI